jgi:hypothetical protein
MTFVSFAVLVMLGVVVIVALFYLLKRRWL